MRPIVLSALLTQTTCLLVPSLKLRSVNLPAVPILRQIATTSAAVLPLSTSLPAMAVTEASDIDDLAGPLTAALGFFVAVIGYFAFAAASEVADQADERMDRLGLKNQKARSQGRRTTTVYDDTDYTYAKNQQAVTNSRDRKKQSKQFGKDGKRLAPWMIIDEKRVDKARAARRENKRKTGKFFG